MNNKNETIKTSKNEGRMSYLWSLKTFRFFIYTLILSIAGTLFLLFIYFIKNMTLIDACDGAFGSFAILFGYGTLKILTNFGTFDMLGYTASKFGIIFRDTGSKPKYKDLIEYKEVRVEKRKAKRFDFIPFYISSAILLIVAITLLLIHTFYQVPQVS